MYLQSFFCRFHPTIASIFIGTVLLPIFRLPFSSMMYSALTFVVVIPLFKQPIQMDTESSFKAESMGVNRILV